MKESTLSTIALIILTILAAIATAIALCLYFGDDATPAEPTIETPAEKPAPVEEAAPAKVRVKIIHNWEQFIEGSVNEWLAANPDVEVISIQYTVVSQNSNARTVTITYAEK